MRSTPLSIWRFGRSLLAALVAILIAGAALELSVRIAKSIGFAQAVHVTNEPRDARPVDGLFAEERSSFRILVLGDSMAYSPGLPASAVWSTALEKALEDTLDRSVEIVNAARGGDNTFSQLRFLESSLKEHAGAPSNAADLVLLLYNHNDVYGTRSSPSTVVSEQPVARPAPQPKSSVPVRPERAALVARIARTLRRNSKFGELLLTRLGNQSRAWGYLVPGTEFHHLASVAYGPDSAGWRAARTELQAINDIVRANGARLGVFVLPQFASLQHDFFAQARAEIEAVASGLGVPVGFGYPEFRGRPWQELAMSPFDGHPNAQANQEIAIVVQEWLQRTQLLKRRNPRNEQQPNDTSTSGD